MLDFGTESLNRVLFGELGWLDHSSEIFNKNVYFKSYTKNCISYSEWIIVPSLVTSRGTDVFSIKNSEGKYLTYLGSSNCAQYSEWSTDTVCFVNQNDISHTVNAEFKIKYMSDRLSFMFYGTMGEMVSVNTNGCIIRGAYNARMEFDIYKV